MLAVARSAALEKKRHGHAILISPLCLCRRERACCRKQRKIIRVCFHMGKHVTALCTVFPGTIIRTASPPSPRPPPPPPSAPPPPSQARSPLPLASTALPPSSSSRPSFRSRRGRGRCARIRSRGPRGCRPRGRSSGSCGFEKYN